MTENNRKIVSKKEYPEEGITEVIRYDVEVVIDGETFRKGFNLDPEQDIHGHVDRWVEKIEASKNRRD